MNDLMKAEMLMVDVITNYARRHANNWKHYVREMQYNDLTKFGPLGMVNRVITIK